MNETHIKRLRILAVDDEPDILEIYYQALSHVNDRPNFGPGFDVTLCRQGDEALETIKKTADTDEPFAVVFLDLNLGSGPDGLSVGEEIRKIDPYLNFVIVTGLLDVMPREIALRIPPLDKILYVQKPFHVQEIRHFAAALGAKWQSEILLRESGATLEKKVKELEQKRRELVDSKLELENVNEMLIDTNSALSVLARNLEKSRKESEKRILQKTKTLILPIIEKLYHARRLEKYREDLDLLTGFLETLTSGLGEDKISASLSASEMRIASLIKNGMSSNEIARHLNVSLYTVKTHRKNIRKKLSLQNSGVNLRSYLDSQDSHGE
ncbi:MAG: response regulator [Desulfobacterales bacterium]|uniref:Response regulator n=1 Tax=Candidatus Desulfatibia vada TaxID=2841696 RepID=A0A8J6NZR1_9BACT|nr:response regulator [Candidatus Desulfatibia vada]